jgi:MHS family shikimate/dehydroshikimate transporter-like MFS transporter
VVQQLKMPAGVGSTGTAIAAAVALVMVPLSAVISDRFGRKRVYLIASIYSAVIAFPVFWLIDTKVPGAIFLGLVLGFGIGVHAVYGPMAAYFAELFGTRTRYTGASLGYQVGGAVFTGFSPLMATGLLAWSGGSSWPIPVLIVAAAVVSIAASQATRVERIGAGEAAQDLAVEGAASRGRRRFLKET